MGYQINVSAEPKKIRGKILFPWSVIRDDLDLIEIGKGNAETLEQALVVAGNAVLNDSVKLAESQVVVKATVKRATSNKGCVNIVVAGSRSFQNAQLLAEELDKYIKTLKGKPVCIISGGAKGADQLGEEYAKKHDYPLKVMKAQWEKYGKSAGFIRNSEVLDYVKDNGDCIVFAFWDTKSSGTKHLIDNAKRRGIKVKVIEKTGGKKK